MIIPESYLAHGLFGRGEERANHKYVARIPTGKNSYRYFYSAAEYKAYKMGKSVGNRVDKMKNHTSNTISAYNNKVRNQSKNPKSISDFAKGMRNYTDSLKNGRINVKPNGARDYSSATNAKIAGTSVSRNMENVLDRVYEAVTKANGHMYNVQDHMNAMHPAEDRSVKYKTKKPKQYDNMDDFKSDMQKSTEALKKGIHVDKLEPIDVISTARAKADSTTANLDISNSIDKINDYAKTAKNSSNIAISRTRNTKSLNDNWNGQGPGNNPTDKKIKSAVDKGRDFANGVYSDASKTVKATKADVEAGYRKVMSAVKKYGDEISDWPKAAQKEYYEWLSKYHELTGM